MKGYFFSCLILSFLTFSTLSAYPNINTINSPSVFHTDTVSQEINPEAKNDYPVIRPAISPAEEEPEENTAVKAEENSIADVSLRVRNIDYYYLRDERHYNNEPHLFFRAEDPSPVAELRVYPEKPGTQFNNLKLLPSAEFSILDSMIFINNEYYRVRIRFNDITESISPGLIFSRETNEGNNYNREVKLFPYFITSLHHDGEIIELFQGEEKVIDIPGNNLFNLLIDEEWKTTPDFHYRLTVAGDNLRLFVKALKTGSFTLPLSLQTNLPFISETGQLSFSLEPLELKFNAKPTRLKFINTNKETVFFESDRRRSQEIILDYHHDFQLKKTYRIEDRQEAGGILLAELFVKSFTTDNRVLAELKTYEHHRASESYLYIKDGSRTLFMTNFSIVNRPEINNIEILREGAEWNKNLSVHPGEKIEVKLEGLGLLDVDLSFDGCTYKQDSIRKSDRAIFYIVQIPLDIPRRKIMIFMNREITRHELLVKEYQRPAPLDFVYVNYGEADMAITDEMFAKPVFYSKTIRDINIIFDRDKIDQEKLFGRQHLTIEIRILDDKNRLLDLQTINNITICPGEQSPRHAFYSDADCSPEIISINEKLLRKTYLLDAFSQVIITVKHNENRYSTPGSSQRINIFAERKTTFDIMVSFPAGLLVKEFKEPGVGNLSGISSSVLAEISFYDPKRIGSKKPYKFGIGFIALNAFNFSDNENIKRDIGLVAITAIEPVRSGTKFSVPIYFGFGYLLNENDMFAIFGPGIRLHF